MNLGIILLLHWTITKKKVHVKKKIDKGKGKCSTGDLIKGNREKAYGKNMILIIPPRRCHTDNLLERCPNYSITNRVIKSSVLLCDTTAVHKLPCSVCKHLPLHDTWFTHLSFTFFHFYNNFLLPQIAWFGFKVLLTGL